ncbi:MAG: class I SAM-dependent methyltransferase [Thermoplasmata archaeon]
MDEKKEIVRKGYDSCVNNYYEIRDSLFDEDNFQDFLKELLEEGRILDVGCGIGEPVTRCLVDQGYNVVGIDISREMLKKAREDIPEADFVHQDMTTLSFTKDSFIGLTAFYSIIHVPKEEHLSLFKRFNDILKLDGVMLISLGSSEWEGKNPDFLGSEMFWSHHSPEKSLGLINESGFEIIENYFVEKYWNDQKEVNYWVLAKNKK